MDQPSPKRGCGARRRRCQKTAATLAYYGNGQLKVLSFYASPVEVRRGSRALVCYGVSNASAVRIEPALGETWPSTGRCVEVTATKDTEYKLTAQDSAGHEETRPEPEGHPLDGNHPPARAASLTGNAARPFLRPRLLP